MLQKYFIYVFNFQFFILTIFLTLASIYKSRRCNTTGRGVYLDCNDCFGYFHNPKADPCCQYGCAKYVAGRKSTDVDKYVAGQPISRKKPKIFSKHPPTEPSILIKLNRKPKTTAKNKEEDSYPSLLGVTKSSSEDTLLYMIIGAGILLVVLIIILKLENFKRRRAHRVSFMEPPSPSITQYIA